MYSNARHKVTQTSREDSTSEGDAVVCVTTSNILPSFVCAIFVVFSRHFALHALNTYRHASQLHIMPVSLVGYLGAWIVVPLIYPQVLYNANGIPYDFTKPNTS